MFASWLLLLAVGAVAAGVAAYRARWSAVAVQRRALREAPITTIAELPASTIARLVGTVRAIGEPLIAPLSGVPCVYYAARAYHDTEVVAEEVNTLSFALDDGTGGATIDLTHATVALAAAHGSSGLLRAPDAAQLAFLRRNGSDDGWSYRYEEQSIQIGGTLAVLGFGSRDAAGHLTMRPLAVGDDADTVHVAVPVARARLPASRRS